MSFPGPGRVLPHCRGVPVAPPGGVEAFDVEDPRAVVGDDLRGVRAELVVVVGGQQAVEGGVGRFKEKLHSALTTRWRGKGEIRENPRDELSQAAM